MSWLKVDDTTLTHPKFLLLRHMEDHKRAPAITAEAVVGFVMLAATWSGQHNTDFFIPETAGPLASALHWRELAAAALKAKILTRAPAAARKAHGGQPGWMVKVGDGEIFHLLTKEQIDRNRAHRAFGRRVESRIEVLLRDGDQCRYCAQTVSQDDRKGGRGRTWDHPDPEVNDVIVVACRSCNSSKRKRTVEEWVQDGGRPLLDEPAKRGEDIYLEDKTRAWLEERGAFPPPARAGSQPDDAATADAADQARSTGNAASPSTTAAASTRTRSESDLDPVPPTVAGRAAPGRDGPGRVGSGPPPSPPPPARTRDGPRRRGSRGRGRRQPPVPDQPERQTA